MAITSAELKMMIKILDAGKSAEKAIILMPTDVGFSLFKVNKEVAQVALHTQDNIKKQERITAMDHVAYNNEGFIEAVSKVGKVDKK